MPRSYKFFLQKLQSKVMYYFTRSGLENLNYLAPWKYLMSINNLEMGMPYTLGDYIIINNEMIGRGNNGIISKDVLIEIIVHERLHIIQRLYQRKFNNFYRQKYPFLKKKYHLSQIPKKLRAINMTNPDSNSRIWTYEINNKEYIPILVYNNNSLIKLGFNKNNLQEKIRLSNNTSYHPNEKFAHEVSNKICLNTLDIATYKFLKSL